MKLELELWVTWEVLIEIAEAEAPEAIAAAMDTKREMGNRENRKQG